jgi:hypothetical protein
MMVITLEEATIADRQGGRVGGHIDGRQQAHRQGTDST